MLSRTVDVGTSAEIWLHATTEMFDVAEPVGISPPDEGRHSRVSLGDDEAIVR